MQSQKDMLIVAVGFGVVTAFGIIGSYLWSLIF